MEHDKSCVVFTEANAEALRRSVVDAARGSVIVFTCASITAYSLFSAPPAAAQDQGTGAAQGEQPLPEAPRAEPILKPEEPVFKPVEPIFKPAPALRREPFLKPSPTLKRELLVRPQLRIQPIMPIWNDEDAIGRLNRSFLDENAQSTLCAYLRDSRARLRIDTEYDRLSAAVRDCASLTPARKAEMQSLYPIVYRMKLQLPPPVASIAEAIAELESQAPLRTPKFASARSYLMANKEAVRRDTEYPRVLRGIFATRRLDDPGKRGWLAELDPTALKAYDSEIGSPADLLDVLKSPAISARMEAKADAYCAGKAQEIAKDARKLDILAALGRNQSLSPQAKKRMSDALIDAYTAPRGSYSSGRSAVPSGCSSGCTLGCTRSCTSGCTAWCTGGCQGACTMSTGCRSGCTTLCISGTSHR